MASFVTRNAHRGGMLPLSVVAEVADHLGRGGLAVLPTETGYMLAARALDLGAVEKVFEAKERDAADTIHVAFSDMSMVRRFAEVDSISARILGAFTPGPLTVVVRQRPSLPTGAVTVDGTVGVRVPEHPGTMQVISAVGAPLTATSLNLSGGPIVDPRDDVAMRSLKWRPSDSIFVVRDDRASEYSVPSTLVRVIDGVIEVLRPGPIPEKDILVTARRIGYLDVDQWT